MLLGVPSGTTVQRKFPTTAMNSIQVRATDKDASTGEFSQLAVAVSTHVLRDDGFGNTDLIWGGTELLDAVYVLASGPALQLFVRFDGLQFVNRLEAIGAGVTGTIILYDYGFSEVLIGDGGDVIVGGFLGDLLFGEGGNDVILGGTQALDGGDLMFGGEGKDVLFSHYGAVTLHGGAGEDLLISDRYAFNDVPQAVQKIANEWRSSRPYAERVSNILGITSPGVNGSDVLGVNVTVAEDGYQDELIGGLGEIDWFLYDFEQDILGNTIEVGETETDTAL